MSQPRIPLAQLHTTATGRRATQPEQDAALERDLRDKGMIVEALVLAARPDGGYDVIDGNRRVRLARKLGFTDAPYVDTTTDDPYATGTLMNLLHAPIRDVDVADFVLQKFVEGGGASADDALTVLNNIRKAPESDADAVRVIARVTKQLGIGAWEDYLPTLLKLLRLPEDVLTPLRDGAITSTQAAALKTIKEEQTRAQMISRAENESLSAKDIKQVIRDENLNPPKEEKPEEPKAQKIASGIEDAENIVSARLDGLSPAEQSRVKRLMRDVAEVFRKAKAKQERSAA